MPLLPFHRYIGSDNPVDKDIPVNENDCIAALRDIRHHNGSSSHDVLDNGQIP